MREGQGIRKERLAIESQLSTRPYIPERYHTGGPKSGQTQNANDTQPHIALNSIIIHNKSIYYT